MWQQNWKTKETKKMRERMRSKINYRHFCTVVILHFVGEIVTPLALSLSLHLLLINQFAHK
jgi:hypothetical protein